MRDEGVENLRVLRALAPKYFLRFWGQANRFTLNTGKSPAIASNSGEPAHLCPTGMCGLAPGACFR